MGPVRTEGAGELIEEKIENAFSDTRRRWRPLHLGAGGMVRAPRSADAVFDVAVLRNSIGAVAADLGPRGATRTTARRCLFAVGDRRVGDLYLAHDRPKPS